MELKVQKRIAAQILKCSYKKVVFDPNRLDEIKEAITKADIRNLIRTGAIIRKQDVGVSRVRAKERHEQKRKGKRRGYGSRKGTEGARENKKRRWINNVRLQRSFLKELKKNKIIDNKAYRDLYAKVKGGFFRSKRHIKLYMEEHKIGKK